MNDALRIKTAACREYERLLNESQRALEIWNEQRVEICKSRVSGRKTDDALRRLQAQFARAYAVLRKHVEDCLLCQFESGMEERDFENGSRVIAENKLYV